MSKPIILCVDDEKIVLKALEIQLGRKFGHQYSFEYAETGDEAIEIVQEIVNKGEIFPLIISDQQMPGLKGNELLKKVHKISAKTLKILLTGQADASAIGDIVNNASLYRYISKPWDAEDLTLTITEALRSFLQDKKIEEQNTELEKLVQELKEYNETLEKKVEKRTELINMQKEEIAHALEILLIQKDEIELSHKQITDSIAYAQRIQNAVLPNQELINTLLPEHFILFKPRDIVSGDFYFVKQIRNHLLVAAADCTGHGVPGAFMSMLGVAFLNEITQKPEIQKASQVLNELRKQIKQSLQQTGKYGEQQDGMDIAFCSINIQTLEMSFAGAYNPCWIFRTINNEEGAPIHYSLFALEADHMPVGVYLKEHDFSEKKIQLQKGDIFYIFSDGFHSQFGGVQKNKYKIKQLNLFLQTICHLPLSEQKELLETEFTRWKGKEEQTDDVLILGVRV